MPERSVNPKFKERADEAAEVVTQDLRENLVDLRRRRLGANAGSKLGLDHMEGGFDIRPLVIVREELLAMVGEELVHSSPQFPTALRDAGIAPLAPIPASGVVVRLEGYQRKRPSLNNSVEVGVADVALVSGDGLDREPLLRPLEEGG